MKTKPLLAALCLSAVVTASAQTQTPAKAASVGTVPSKDILKLNLASLSLKNVSVQYEYVLSKKLSLALGFRVMPMTAIPFSTALGNAFAGDNADAKNLLDISRLGNVAVTPELRYYFGRGHGRGFYAAPYYRFSSFSSNTLTVNYAAPNGPRRSVTLNGDLTAHSGGLLLGAQWNLGNAVVLDWWILGAHYGGSNGRFLGTPSTALSEGEQDVIEKQINDLDFPLLTKTVTTSSRSVDVRTTGAFGGLRSGLCLGIRF